MHARSAASARGRSPSTSAIQPAPSSKPDAHVQVGRVPRTTSSSSSQRRPSGKYARSTRTARRQPPDARRVREVRARVPSAAQHARCLARGPGAPSTRLVRTAEQWLRLFNQAAGTSPGARARRIACHRRLAFDRVLAHGLQQSIARLIGDVLSGETVPREWDTRRPSCSTAPAVRRGEDELDRFQAAAPGEYRQATQQLPLRRRRAARSSSRALPAVSAAAPVDRARRRPAGSGADRAAPAATRASASAVGPRPARAPAADRRVAGRCRRWSPRWLGRA